jgi:hypothetical protein
MIEAGRWALWEEKHDAPPNIGLQPTAAAAKVSRRG